MSGTENIPSPGPKLSEPECACVGVAKEAWRPKIDEHCLFTYADGDTKEVVVRGIYDNRAWVFAINATSSVPGLSVLLSDLRPIPSEPKVKNGDHVRVEQGEQFLGGVAVCVELDRFKLCGGRNPAGNLLEPITPWINFGDAAITRLVPDTLYAKMKKRLEELKESYTRFNRNGSANTCRTLLSDLEVYAKGTQP